MPGAPTVSVTLRISAKTRDRLSATAKAKGLGSTTAYAQMLFDAGYAARIGQEREEPPVDRELDTQVRLVFACAGQADTAAIAKATGVPEPRVVRILEGFKALRREGKF